MSKPLLLIVDDEVDIAELVGDVGKSTGFDIQISNSAREFKKSYISQQPSAIVMDIVMPDMDGIELINWLAENNCLTPIIFMSGYDILYIETAQKLASRKGCHVAGTLTKPFAMEEIEALLLRIIND